MHTSLKGNTTMKSSSKNKLFAGDFAKVFFAGTFMFTAFYMLLPTLPIYITTNLRLDGRNTGLILAIFTIAALAIRPFTGFLLDKFGRKIFFICGYAIFGLLFGSYPLASVLIAMLLVRFLHGIAWGVATTASSTLIVDIIPPHRRGEGIGLYGLSMTIPMALGPLLGLKMSEYFGYKELFIGAMILTIIGFVITLSINYPKRTVSENLHFNWKNLFEKTSIPVTLNLLLINIAYGGLVAFVSLYAIETHIGNTASFFIIFAIGVTVSRIYGGRIFDRKGPYLIAISGIVLLTLGYLLLGLTKSFEVFLLSGILTGLGSGVLFPAFQAMVNNLVPEKRRGAANSTLFTGLDLGIGIGMLLCGYMGQKIGYANTYLSFSGLSIVALLFFIFYTYKHYRLTIQEHKR